MDRTLTAYTHLVAGKYQDYNALFLRLPFYGVPEAGRLLPKFTEYCIESLQKKMAPDEIVNQFFREFSDEEKYQQLFLFLQFVERQIVLFDALEDCAFGLTHDFTSEALIDNLPPNTNVNDFKIRLVLTAHPTQFYTPYVLNIIQDLSNAIKKEDVESIKKLLLQMGKTPFLAKQKPSPLEEADFLIRYLKNIFYPSIQNISYRLFTLTNKFTDSIHLGFWPGADRDGNPNVTSETTLIVAKHLKKQLLKCYRKDLKKLARRLTFFNTIEKIKEIIDKLELYSDKKELLNDLYEIRKIILEEHDALFVELTDQFIATVNSFGLHFASLDLRQDSRVHSNFISEYIEDYAKQSTDKKIALIEEYLNKKTPEIDVDHDCITSLKTIPTIQSENGEAGMHRYIISNTQSAANVLEILLLCKWAGLNLDNLKLDIVPLFETINDLVAAQDIMTDLYSNQFYREHLKNRNNTQTIMLGFSDGTKDGGYITANWSIYLAKKKLSALAKKDNIDVIFFDGRGGPPSRGGGNTYRYYQGQESDIARKEIQLTIQGQTISSNFGTEQAAIFNIEQLFTAGIVVEKNKFTFDNKQLNLMDELSKISAEKYNKLKNHPQFYQYLEKATPLNFYGELNIASRPPKRGQSKKLSLDDLRAIPFVGAWTLMKQNVPGYYGVGTALKALINNGEESNLKNLYRESLYFKTLLDNTMQSLKKTFFPLTQYLSEHPDFGELWHDLYDEAVLTKKMLCQISGCQELLEEDPVTKLSIELREKIVLPLQIIQQYALINLQKNNHNSDIMKKLIVKSISTNINASRNSV